MSSFLSVRPRRTGACFSVRKGSPQQDTGTGGAPQGAKAGSAGASCRAGRGPPRHGSADRCRTPYPPRNYRPARDDHFSPAQSGQKANVERPFPVGSRQARDPRLPSSTPANRHGTPPVVRRRTGTGPVKSPAGDPCRKTPPRHAARGGRDGRPSPVRLPRQTQSGQPPPGPLTDDRETVPSLPVSRGGYERPANRRGTSHMDRQAQAGKKPPLL